MNEIYLDHAATGVVRKEALAAFNGASAIYGNPSSLHGAGMEAKRLVDASRAEVAHAFGVGAGEIIFTSGGSESNNQAIFGLSRLRARRAKRVILTDSEHPSVENPVRALAEQGFEPVYIPTRGGKLDIPALEEALTVPTALVCVMLANNETGAVYDIAAVRSAITRARSEAFFHCDAVQGFLKAREYTQIKKYCDTASVSAHKIGGVKGVGALFVKNGIKIPPFILGGGQEGGLRSGTENVAGIAAFAAACKAFKQSENEHIYKLRQGMLDYFNSCGGNIIARTPENAVPSILSISVPGVRSEVMLNALSAEGIYVSAGSACSASRKGVSRVLEAYGMPREELESAIRISFGATNTYEECVFAAERIAANAKRLRR